MKLKMFSYMAAFTAIVIIILWVFQIILLDDIYKSTVKAETKGLASAITLAARLDDEEFTTRVYNMAANNASCVSVYEITDGFGREIVNAHSQNLCIIHSHMLSESFLANIYANAKSQKIYVDDVVTGKNDNGSILCA